MAIYKNYTEYLNSRKDALTNLGKVMPQVKDMHDTLQSILDDSFQHVRKFDNLKVQMEKIIGKEIEYGEVDIYLQMMSGLIVQDLEDISVDAILKGLDKYFPGIYDEGIIKRAEHATEVLVEKVITNIE